MKNPEIESFIKDVDRIVHDGGTEEVLTGKIAERMRHLLQADNILPSQYRQPNPKYALYPLYIADDESFSSRLRFGMLGNPLLSMIMERGA